jgi:rRNA maturation protein Nop10
MLEPMLSDTMVFQGPMRLADTLFCLDCEVMFTSLESCPSCAGSAIWPVAAWLSPSQLHLSIASTPMGAPPRFDPAAKDAKAVA